MSASRQQIINAFDAIQENNGLWYARKTTEEASWSLDVSHHGALWLMRREGIKTLFKLNFYRIEKLKPKDVIKACEALAEDFLGEKVYVATIPDRKAYKILKDNNGIYFLNRKSFGKLRDKFDIWPVKKGPSVFYTQKMVEEAFKVKTNNNGELEATVITSEAADVLLCREDYTMKLRSKYKILPKPRT